MPIRSSLLSLLVLTSATLVKEWREQAIIAAKSEDMLGSIGSGRLNVLEGTFGAVDDKGEKIDFTHGGTTIKLPLANAKGMLFTRGAPKDAAPIVCKFQ